MNLSACDFVVGGMLMYDRQRDVLECLVDSESLDGVLVRLIAIAEKKAQSRHENRLTATQWARTMRRLTELRAWCAKFGPGSGCR
jgi:hypothetical protein